MIIQQHNPMHPGAFIKSIEKWGHRKMGSDSINFFIRDSSMWMA